MQKTLIELESKIHSLQCATKDERDKFIFQICRQLIQDKIDNQHKDEHIVESNKTINSQTEISINELKSICQSVIDNTPSDATEKEIGYTKAMEHIIKIIGAEPHKYPQTEISDEEIEKAIIDQDVVKQEGYCHCFLEGAKWYREQLKNK